MSRIAVVGAGISGLTAAYLLSRKYDVFVFERDHRLGGHTHTVRVDAREGPLAIDTGFIVHNDSTYPNFCRLLSELGVVTQPSDMSFAVTSPGASFEYSSRGLGGFFAQRTNLVTPSHYKLFLEILRFNRQAAKWLRAQDVDDHDLTMAQFLDAGHYNRHFIERYLYPMASAVWSMPQDELGGFPALTMIRFMHNHGILGINTHPQWKTIRGGSQQYIEPLISTFGNRIHKGVEITKAVRVPDGVQLVFVGQPAMTFDHVVFACPAKHILEMLAPAADIERDVLQHFSSTRNEVCLHTDQRMLPKRRAARASWNYSIGHKDRVTMTYHMNRLQAFSSAEAYCVTLNAEGAIAPDRVITKMSYFHPVFDRATVRAQLRWSEISGRDRIHYCGAWWFYGFHEDGVRSAVRVAAALGVNW